MSIYKNIPYTYQITWSSTGMKYYGARWAKNCHPADLFVSYFTSSKHVALYIEKNGLPDITEIIKTFTGDDSVKNVRLFEAEELKRLNAVLRDDYLNKHDGIRCTGNMIMPHDETIYEWHNINGDKINCTRLELVTKYNLHAASINRIILNLGLKSHHGWYLKKDNPRGMKDYFTTYDWIHLDGKMIALTRKEMADKYGLSIDETKKIINGKVRKGWRLVTSINSKRDNKIYSFTHLDGTIVNHTRQEMLQKFDLSVHGMKRLINGKKKYLMGWRLSENSLTPRSRNDKHQYTFKHESGIEETCTRFELAKKYQLKINSVGRVATGKRISYMGWRLSPHVV